MVAPPLGPAAPMEILLVGDGTATMSDPLVGVVPGPVAEVDMYDVAATLDADRHAAIVITGGVDQEDLWNKRATIERYLGDGGVVMFCGHLLRRWLPGCAPFEPATIDSMHDYDVRFVTPHPIYDGIEPAHLAYQRGVAGFFARGSHAPPPGATVLAELAGGQPITYVDRRSGGGTVLAHAGSSLLHVGGGDTSARLGPQCAAWIRAEAQRRRQDCQE